MDTSFTVLVVDDEPVVRATEISILEEAGLSVIEAYNGRDALRLLLKHPEIELLIADVRMAGLTGDSLGFQARKLRPDLRILLTSGYFDASPSPDFQFVPKPWREAELQTILGTA